MSQKVIKRGVLIRFEYFFKYVGNLHIYQEPKSNSLIAADTIRAHKVLFNLQIYLFQNFFEITHVPLQCSNIPQYFTHSTCM